MKQPILNNRIFLYLTEFFAGMSVMAVELGASRLMAPYFSSSQIVWTIIIGTIMIAMALGNIYGGRSADRNPNPDRLYGRMIIAAVWIAAIPVFGKYVIVAISAVLIFSVSSNFLIWAAFAACMIIFVFPLFLLGTVTPSLAKYTVESLEDNGKTVGNLGAFNTIGSIIGTFVPTFISIPAVGTAVTFLIFAGILLALGIIYFVSTKTGKKRVASSLAIFLVCCVFGHESSFAFWEGGLAYEGESIYNYLQVKDDPQSAILSTNVLFGVQSVFVKEEGLTGMYYDYAMLAPYMGGVYEKERMNVLILGMGTGTYATQCMRYFDNMDIEGVEIDQKIIDLSRSFFSLSEDVLVTAYDGRAYLNAVDKTYDIIMVDAYQDITIPFQMSSTEFFMLVQKALTEDGVMVVNMNMRGSKEGSINDYLADTIAGVFSQVCTVDVPFTTNRELFASNNPYVTERLMKNAAMEKDAALAAMIGTAAAGLEDYEAGDLRMTDDRAPVELLGMQVIDDIIKEEVRYYKAVYEERGIEGLLEQM